MQTDDHMHVFWKWPLTELDLVLPASNAVRIHTSHRRAAAQGVVQRRQNYEGHEFITMTR